MMWRKGILVKSYAQRGKFIVLEGIEGCGKSTLLQQLAHHFRSIGKQALTTREPGGTPLGESIRSLVLQHQHVVVHPLAELFLMEAARVQHCQDVILPALSTHDFVLCDRFTLSSLAYQGKARGLGLDLVSQLNAIAIQSCTPDAILYIDLSPEEASARRHHRNQQDPSSLDKIERESHEFHQTVAQGYHEALTREPNIHVLDGRASPDVLAQQAIEVIGRL